MDLTKLKKLFAAALVREPGNPFKAAMSVFPDDVGSALLYAPQWNIDSEVIAEMNKIEEESELIDIIPTKKEAALLAWTLANNDWLKGKERVDALRLFSEIAGHMPDKTVNKNIKNDNAVNRVMIVKDHGEDDEWELKLATQQKGLIDAE